MMCVVCEMCCRWEFEVLKYFDFDVDVLDDEGSEVYFESEVLTRLTTSRGKTVAASANSWCVFVVVVIMDVM